jgi:S1-C subfamily serine protease
MGGSGVVVGEEAWAEKFSLGPMILNEVPVQPASRSDVATGSAHSPYQATLGLTALQRLDFIVDGGAGIAYVRPRSGPFPPYLYNRAGAVFTPRDPGRDKSNQLVAHVLEDGPAYQAGIRDGDIVLKLGQQWATNWTEGPTGAATKRPAGSKLELTLKRGEKTFSSVVVLRDLFPPAASSTNESAKVDVLK